MDRRPGIVAAALCLVPMMLVAVSSVHGLAARPDSAGYVAAARSFASDWQFTHWDGQPMSHFPPGFPLILGTVALIGIDPKVSAIVLNILAAGAFVALTYAVGRLVLQAPRPAIVATAIVAVATTILNVYGTLLSEAVFVTLCMATVWLLTRMVRDGVRPIPFVAVVATVSLACSVRWIGVSLIPLVALSLMLAESRRGVPRAVAIGVIGGILASAGTAAVALRNLAVDGSLTGSWAQSHATVAHLARLVLTLVGRWSFPPAGPRIALILGLVTFALAAYGALRLLRDRDAWRLAVPVVLFAGGYTVALIISELRVDGVIEDRYLAPVLAPTALLVVAGLRDLWRLVGGSEGSTTRSAGPVRRIAVLGLAGLLAVGGLVYFSSQAISVARFTATSLRSGRGYNAADIRSSELARAAAALPTDAGFLTNDPVLVYWVSGRHPIPSIQALSRDGDPGLRIREGIATGNLEYYAEFAKPHTTQGVPADALRAWGVLLQDPVAYADGTLYRMSVGPGS